MTSKKIRLLVIAAFFVALDIIFARFFSFEFPSPMGPVKYDVQIIISALCGFALGPLWGSITLVASDILGAMLFGGSLGFFFGFTISAFFRGLIFGWLLQNKEASTIRLLLSVLLVFIIVDFGLNTFWLSILLGTPYLPLLVSRIIPKGIALCVNLVLVVCVKKLFTLVRSKVQL